MTASSAFGDAVTAILWIAGLSGVVAFGVLGSRKQRAAADEVREIAVRAGLEPEEAVERWKNSDDRAAVVDALQARADLARLKRTRIADRDARGPALPIQPARPRTPAERMKDLQDLYRQGLIGEDEFAQKRREILGDV